MRGATQVHRVVTRYLAWKHAFFRRLETSISGFALGTSAAPSCPYMSIFACVVDASVSFRPVLLSFSLDENGRSAGENRHIEFGAALTFGLGRAGFSGDALVLFRGKKGAVPCQGDRGGKRGDRVNSWNRQTGHARSRPGPSVNAHISIGGVPRLPGLSRCHRRWLFPRPACTPQQPFRPPF